MSITTERMVTAACTGKTAFANAKSALRAIKRMIRARSWKVDHGRHLNAYRCRYCQNWHVGNTE